MNEQGLQKNRADENKILIFMLPELIEKGYLIREPYFLYDLSINRMNSKFFFSCLPTIFLLIDFDMCEAILARIEDKNPHDATGITPLHISVEQSNFRIVKLILDNLQSTPFYNPNPADSDGETPLHLAARRGNFDIFSYIFNMVIYQRVLTRKQLEDRDLDRYTPFVYYGNTSCGV